MKHKTRKHFPHIIIQLTIQNIQKKGSILSARKEKHQVFGKFNRNFKSHQALECNISYSDS